MIWGLGCVQVCDHVLKKRWWNSRTTSRFKPKFPCMCFFQRSHKFLYQSFLYIINCSEVSWDVCFLVSRKLGVATTTKNAHESNIFLCNQKEGTPRMLPGALSDPPLGPSYVLSGAQSICYLPDSLRLKDYCAEPHSATSDHTDGPSEPHELTTQKLFGLWPQIEHLQCTCTARHRG
jgi:hypothetical protein